MAATEHFVHNFADVQTLALVPSEPAPLADDSPVASESDPVDIRMLALGASGHHDVVRKAFHAGIDAIRDKFSELFWRAPTSDREDVTDDGRKLVSLRARVGVRISEGGGDEMLRVFYDAVREVCDRAGVAFNANHAQ